MFATIVIGPVLQRAQDENILSFSATFCKTLAIQILHGQIKDSRLESEVVIFTFDSCVIRKCTRQEIFVLNTFKLFHMLKGKDQGNNNYDSNLLFQIKR